LIKFLVIPVEPYNPDDFCQPDEKDETLMNLMEFLSTIKDLDDVREPLIETFNLRQIAINSKLL